MPLTDEEAIALAVLDGMECIEMHPGRQGDHNRYEAPPVFQPRDRTVVALVWEVYRKAPNDLRGGFNSHAELAHLWCKWKGLS